MPTMYGAESPPYVPSPSYAPTSPTQYPSPDYDPNNPHLKNKQHNKHQECIQLFHPPNLGGNVNTQQLGNEIVNQIDQIKADNSTPIMKINTPTIELPLQKIIQKKNLLS